MFFTGPAISDNCRGLAVLTAIAQRAARRARRDRRDVTFVANVGEEGLGDLRGVKALFGETLKGQVDRSCRLTAAVQRDERRLSAASAIG